MGCGEFIVKYILFFVNLFFALAGLTLLGIGIALQLQVATIVDINGSVELAPIGTMVVGCVVFVIAFFGCCGAIRESNCMLIMYTVLMVILMVLKITLASLIFVNMPALTEELPRWLNTTFNQPNQQAFHEIESTFKCCGTTGGAAYGLNLTLPASCCAADTCTLLNAYPGCNTVVVEFFNTFGLVIGILAIGVVAVELVAVVFALCLANHARNMARRSRY